MIHYENQKSMSNPAEQLPIIKPQNVFIVYADFKAGNCTTPCTL